MDDPQCLKWSCFYRQKQHYFLRQLSLSNAYWQCIVVCLEFPSPVRMFVTHNLYTNSFGSRSHFLWLTPFIFAQDRQGTAGSGGCQRLEIQASKDEKVRRAGGVGITGWGGKGGSKNIIGLCETHGIDAEWLNHLSSKGRVRGILSTNDSCKASTIGRYRQSLECKGVHLKPIPNYHWLRGCRKTWTLVSSQIIVHLERETHFLTDCNIKSAKVFVGQLRHIPWIIAELIGRGHLKSWFPVCWWHAPSCLVRPSEGKCTIAKMVQQLSNGWTWCGWFKSGNTIYFGEWPSIYQLFGVNTRVLVLAPAPPKLQAAGNFRR